jgi:N6-L-threonylcarbamoyladenine synthase
LKTAVRYAIQPPGSEAPPKPLEAKQIADLAASFQAAVVDCLATKSMLALKRTGARRLCIGGGVAANGALRERLSADCAQRGVELFIPPLDLCTDNAVMGAIAVERLKAGLTEPLDLDAYPAAPK